MLACLLQGLEKYIMTKLHNWAFGQSAADRERDEILLHRIEALEFVQPAHLDIPDAFQDDKPINMAMAELKKIDQFKVRLVAWAFKHGIMLTVTDKAQATNRAAATSVVDGSLLRSDWRCSHVSLCKDKSLVHDRSKGNDFCSCIIVWRMQSLLACMPSWKDGWTCLHHIARLSIGSRSPVAIAGTSLLLVAHKVPPPPPPSPSSPFWPTHGNIAATRR